ncbi:unnamed protein product [Nippostrongylus brasiliensis]|uniref:SCP domain-containing protein n=1 Tax=Nippostrongylus brasiliensis TaxID=27835 RepID=A0A0N4Y446_NIPBR|nr:unnamed protein product [Nippostrongylus brasiliensis]
MMSGLTNEWLADDLRPLQSLIYDGNPDTAYFANFAKWNSTEVACTYGVKNNGNDLILICAYNVKGAVIDEEIYEVAKEGQYPCADGARCGTDGTCMDSLCNVPISNPDTLLPIYTPSLYYNNLPFMTQFSRYYAINLHNYYRRLVASGWAENKLTSFTPRAAKMEALMYDSSLEKVASENVKKCDRQSIRSNNDSAITGSNVKIIEVVGISGEAALEQALGEWFNQLRKHGLDPNSMWAEDPNVKQCANIMHDTYKTVGCAVNTCSSEGFTIVECRYGPKRLQEGLLIYDVGVPCSKCESTQNCIQGALCQ